MGRGQNVDRVTTTSILRALVVAATAAAVAFGSAGPVAAAPSTTTAKGATTAASSQDTKTVSFRGVSVRVPSSWPVVRLAGTAGCVRFDRHAVYLGDPARITCPPHLIGRTQAVHLTTASAQGVVAPDRVVTSAGSDVTAVVSAGDEPAVARQIAQSVDFSGSSEQVTAPSGASNARTFAATGNSTTAERTTSTAPKRSLAAQRKLQDSTFTGQGFDACTARSLSELSTWYSASPYKAVNMYIGGASRGCAQPNLNAAWVSSAVAQGWVLIPTYVGLQAPCREYPNVINPAQASSQGIAAADDAIAQLNALGLGVGNPVYFDMEAFSYSNTVMPPGSAGLPRLVDRAAALPRVRLGRLRQRELHDPRDRLPALRADLRPARPALDRPLVRSHAAPATARPTTPRSPPAAGPTTSASGSTAAGTTRPGAA